MAGSASPIRYIPYEEAYEEGFEDMHRRVPDISRVKNLLNFRTTHDTRQIVQSVIDSFSASAKPRRAGNLSKVGECRKSEFNVVSQRNMMKKSKAFTRHCRESGNPL